MTFKDFAVGIVVDEDTMDGDGEDSDRNEELMSICSTELSMPESDELLNLSYSFASLTPPLSNRSISCGGNLCLFCLAEMPSGGEAGFIYHFCCDLCYLRGLEAYIAASCEPQNKGSRPFLRGFLTWCLVKLGEFILSWIR